MVKINLEISLMSKTKRRDRRPARKIVRMTFLLTNRFFFIRIEAKSKWLPAHNDSVAGINTVGNCIELIDLFAENSVNLVIADFGNILLMPKIQAKLRIFKGFSLLKENNLTDLPCAVVSCFMDNLQPRIPGKNISNFLFRQSQRFSSFSFGRCLGFIRFSFQIASTIFQIRFTSIRNRPS